jgi:hypothetical protein
VSAGTPPLAAAASAGGTLADLAGATVTRFTVDDALTLHCRRADGLTGSVRCDGVAELHHPGGLARVSPDQDPASCGPALSLLHRRIAGVQVEADGSLAIAFQDPGGTGAATKLLVRADEQAVSWAVSLSNGFAAHCLAEGRVLTGTGTAA